MKVNTRPVPLDMLAVTHGKDRITVSTHRQTISVRVTRNGIETAAEYFTPEEFCKLLEVAAAKKGAGK